MEEKLFFFFFKWARSVPFHSERQVVVVGLTLYWEVRKAAVTIK